MGYDNVKNQLQQRTNQLFEILKQDMQYEAVSFSQFMETALYQPQYGYYTGNKINIGKDGDFITMPEMTPLYAYTMAYQFIESWNLMQSSKNIIEFGAGTGQFAHDCISALASMNCLPDQYIIIEISSSLKMQQQEKLNVWMDKVTIVWLSQLPKNKIDSIVFANEVLDAMPVELFTYSESTIDRLGVKYNQVKNNFEFCKISKNDIFDNSIAALIDDGVTFNDKKSYTSELNIWIKPWIKALSESLDKSVVFISDYGYHRNLYYNEQRYTGTLQCYFQHNVHDNPLVNIGIQDITAHIDFTLVAQSAFNARFNVDGYLPQGAFLQEAGINKAYEYLLRKADSNQAKSLLTNHLKNLTLATQWAENFKMIVLTKDIEKNLNVFEHKNLDYLL